MSKKAGIISIIVAVIVAGGLGFWIGTATAKSQTPASRFAAGAGTSGFAGRTRGATGAAGGAVIGQVLSTNADGFVVKLQSGSTQIILASASTTILKTTQGNLSDITAGQNVIVSGTSNPDGSMTASSIQLRSGSGYAGAGMMLQASGTVSK